MGVVLIVTLAFGLITPPYGLALLMASKFVGVRFSQALQGALPIYVVFFATIAFASSSPNVVLWLPKHVLPGIGRLLQEPERRRIHLPVMKAARRCSQAKHRRRDRRRRPAATHRLRPSTRCR